MTMLLSPDSHIPLLVLCSDKQHQHITPVHVFKNTLFQTVRVSSAEEQQLPLSMLSVGLESVISFHL